MYNYSMKRVLLALTILLVTAVASYVGYRTGRDRGYQQATTTSAAETETTSISPQAKPEPIVLASAKDLVEKCRAEGIYRLSNGEAGLIMKGGIFQPVKDATEEGLRAIQNPECPFTRAAIE